MAAARILTGEHPAIEVPATPYPKAASGTILRRELRDRERAGTPA